MQQLFEELGIEPEIVSAGELKHYRASGLDVYAGDICELSSELLGEVDAVYDRAALVALPEDMRPRYASHVTEISGAARKLVITFNYDQSAMDGPPFSIEDEELQAYFANDFDVSLLAGVEVEGRLKGQVDAIEKIWLVKPFPLNQRG